ncbi:MAG: NADH-quinone oxidoreductase subunit D [Candidatus Hydrogenedentes bacterium]|nr:NADH-quinone oxidoreductase subunit D [Candidatus Hydrogenedentota bacterium]
MNNNMTYETADTLRTEELLINMGPQHPSTHGVLRLIVQTDGEMVRRTWPQIGFLHRCFEKIAETIDYAKVVPYTDRMDYLASMNSALPFCLAVEKLGGFEVPDRASYLRVIMAELNRIASHLMAFGCYALDLGAFTPFLYGFRERESILSIFEKISGGRLLYHYPRVGGVARDMTPEIANDIRAFLTQMRQVWPEYNTLLSKNQIFVKRTANVGVVPREKAIAWGLTGPCLRGSGVAFDLRKAHPYSLYEKFSFDVPVGEGTMGAVGDCWDRYWVRMVEMLESCKIVEQALDGLPEGSFFEKVGRSFDVPEGEAYVPCENPRGELGFYIVSDGTSKAFRVKARAPSFCNLSITDAVCRDVLLADVVAIVGSIDIVLGEVDR